MKFRRVYLQKMATVNKVGKVQTYPMKETINDFQLFCGAIPFEGETETKNLPTNEWPDEDGVEMFVPSILPIKAYNIELKFYCKANSIEEANARTKAFRDYLTGRDGTGTRLMVWSEQAGNGRQNCIFQKIEPELNRTKKRSIVTYKVTLKVTDPVTEIEKRETRLAPVNEE